MPRGSRQASPTITSDPAPARAPASPPATRRTGSRWRDPRLAVGVALVAGCALLGARLLAAADDTVGVWAVRHDLAAGQPLTAADVVRREVRFADQADADRYVAASSPVPGGSRLGRAVGAGELLPRASLATGRGAALTEVPLSVPSDAVPSTVRPGAVVDVWVTPDAAGADGTEAGLRSALVLDDVVVVTAPRTGSSLGPTATRQVVVGVGRDQRSRLPVSLAALSTGTVLLTAQR